MESKFRRLAPPGGDYVSRRLESLEREIRMVRSARRLEAATIGFGGVTVEDGGDVTLRDGGSISVQDGGDVDVLAGDVTVSGGGSLVVRQGGGVAVQDGGDVDVTGSGVIRVWGSNSYGTMENGRFGVGTLSGGTFTYPSTLAQPDGFLCDAGPGLGYAVYRVDAASGAAVVSSSVGRVFLSHATTGDAANVRILLNGEILRVTSSRRYKRDIEDAPIDPDAVLAIRGRTWRAKKDVEEDPDTDRRYVGFIAEELDDLGLKDFVDYDEEGRPDAIQYDRLPVALLAVIQRQEKTIEGLAARVEALEASSGPRKAPPERTTE